jgi:hypothetical protein
MIGDGIICDLPVLDDPDASFVKIPNELLLGTSGNLIASIVSAIYPHIEEPYLNMDYFKERAIVTPKNIIVSEINDSYTSTDNRSSQRQPQESLQQQTNIMQQPEDPVASR